MMQPPLKMTEHVYVRWDERVGEGTVADGLHRAVDVTHLRHWLHMAQASRLLFDPESNVVFVVAPSGHVVTVVHVRTGQLTLLRRCLGLGPARSS
jgi:hypothetical protein